MISACGGDDSTTSGDDAEDATTMDSASDPSEVDAADDTGEDAGEQAASDDTADDLVDDLDFGDGLAVVVVGDTTYEFSLGGNSEVGGTTYIGVCQELFGLIQASGYDTQGRAITVEMEIPPEDWQSDDDVDFDPPRIEIEDDENDGGWVADASDSLNGSELAGVSQVGEFTSDGTRAAGTATFVEVEPFGAPVEGAEPIDGSFEVGCAG
jgi:hypothetical protein